MSLSKAIFELRRNNKLSQEEFAKNIGVFKETVEEWENGIFLPASEISNRNLPLFSNFFRPTY